MNVVNRSLMMLVLQAIIISCVVFSAASFALPDDSQQPIHVSSDRAQKDDKRGITIYQGDVNITQGSLNISAEKVTIYSNTDSIDKIIAEGKPARFKQRPEAAGNLVIAHADTIKYELQKESILLLKDASLEQDGTTITGNKIDYDIQAAVVNAGDNKGRVNIVIPAPKKTP